MYANIKKNIGIIVLTMIAFLLQNDTGVSQNRPADKIRAPIKIMVDLKAPQKGQISNKYHPGIFWDDIVSKYSENKFFTDNKTVGAWRLDLATDGGFPYGSKDPPTKKDWENYVHYLSGFSSTYLEAQNHGATTGIDFIGMPRWLSSRPDETGPIIGWAQGYPVWWSSPPKDYRQWSDLISVVVRYYKSQGINNMWYSPWNEPDWGFIGSMEDYMKLYAATVIGVKRIDRNLPVGGPSVSGLYKKLSLFTKNNGEWRETGETKRPFIEMFIEAASKTSIPELGYQKLPIDFIDWHFPENAASDVQYVKALLAKYGYSQNIPMRIGEWTSPAGWTGDGASTESQAAYVIKQIHEFAQAGIYHNYTSLHDQGDYGDGSWANVGAFFGAKSETFFDDYQEGIKAVYNNKMFDVIKPVYNSFLLLSIFSGAVESQLPNQLYVEMLPDDMFTAIASQTQSAGTTRILLSNFTPSSKAQARPFVIDAFKGCMKYNGYSTADAALIVSTLKGRTRKKNTMEEELTADSIRTLIQNTIFPPTLKNEQIHKDLLQCLGVVSIEIEKLRYYVVNPRDVNLSVSHLSPGSHQMTTYLIDADHANPCRYNKKTERYQSAHACGADGEIDRQVYQARADAEKSKKTATLAYLKSKGYTQHDITLVQEAEQRCKNEGGKKGGIEHCINQLLEKNYTKLDRCQPGHTPTTPILCSSSDIVKKEIKDGLEAGHKSMLEMYYYKSAYAIDKINWQHNVIRTRQTKSINMQPANNYYKETINMKPNSVMLIEIN